MEFHSDRAGTTVSCIVGGEIDLAVADELQQRLVDLCFPGGSLTIDCSGVTFIDSLGLRALLAVREEARRLGTSLQLRGVARPMRRLLQVTGLVDAFRIGNGEPSPAGSC